MIKQFILAATSIAYTLSIPSIADANNRSGSSRLNYIPLNYNKVNLVAEYSPAKNTLANANISNKDFKEIYESMQRSILEKVRKSNLANEPKLPKNFDNNVSGKTDFLEIIKLELISVHPDMIDRPIERASIKMTLARRFYNYNLAVYDSPKELRENNYIPTKQAFIFKKSSEPDQMFYPEITLERINNKWVVRSNNF